MRIIVYLLNSLLVTRGNIVKISDQEICSKEKYEAPEFTRFSFDTCDLMTASSEQFGGNEDIKPGRKSILPEW